MPLDEDGRYIPPGAGSTPGVSEEGPPVEGDSADPRGRRGRRFQAAVVSVAVVTAALAAVAVSSVRSDDADDPSGPAASVAAPSSPEVAPGPASAGEPVGEEPVSGDHEAESPPAGLDTVVDRIVDGDTLYVRDLDERVRLIGIDTPETKHPDVGVQCFGREATSYLEELVSPGTAVRVVYDVQRIDRYGRPLGYLYRLDDGAFINLIMVRDGYAQVATNPPNVRHVDEFVEAERQARSATRGLWSACRDE